MEYMHMNPVRRGLVKRPEEWRWSSYSHFALEKASVAARPIQIECPWRSETGVRKAVRKALTAATRSRTLACSPGARCWRWGKPLGLAIKPRPTRY